MEFLSKVSRHYAGEDLGAARSAGRSPGWAEDRITIGRSSIGSSRKRALDRIELALARRAGQPGGEQRRRAASDAATTANVRGSRGVTSIEHRADQRVVVSKLADRRRAHGDTGEHRALPEHAAAADLPGLAPSAARTPSSRVRIDTAYAITP